MTPSLDVTDTTLPATTITLGQTKRVLEWWCCSEAFRQMVQQDPARAGREFGLGFDPALIRPLWDPFHALDVAREQHPVHPAVREYQAFFNSKTEWRKQVKDECSPDDERFRAWRARQIARNALDSGGYDDYIIHTPMAIEITDGCSVGCWFCGVGATKLVEAWRYDQESAALWRDVVSVLREKIGFAARWGFCYWATDPLDNPDYEQFALDFSDIVGMFPQTTTAQAHKDPARVRNILAISQERGCRVNRFSVLTEGLLRKIYQAYTPEELTGVEIVAQMREGNIPKAYAGAFRELAKSKKHVVEVEQKKLTDLADRIKRVNSANGAGDANPNASPIAMSQPGTIACVSGFLLNMVRRTVKLISPCRASEQWPLGYIVFEERTFHSGAELGRHLEEMMANHMPLTIEPEDPVRLNPGFNYERTSDGFNVTTPMNTIMLRRPELSEYIQAIGEQLSAGSKTASEIAFAAFFQHGIPEVNTMGTLSLLFERGLLADAKGRAFGAAPLLHSITHRPSRVAASAQP